MTSELCFTHSQSDVFRELPSSLCRTQFFSDFHADMVPFQCGSNTDTYDGFVTVLTTCSQIIQRDATTLHTSIRSSSPFDGFATIDLTFTTSTDLEPSSFRYPLSSTRHSQESNCTRRHLSPRTALAAIGKVEKATTAKIKPAPESYHQDFSLSGVYITEFFCDKDYPVFVFRHGNMPSITSESSTFLALANVIGSACASMLRVKFTEIRIDVVAALCYEPSHRNIIQRVLGMGLGQDYSLAWLRGVCCPYADLGRKRG